MGLFSLMSFGFAAILTLVSILFHAGGFRGIGLFFAVLAIAYGLGALVMLYLAISGFRVIRPARDQAGAFDERTSEENR